MTRVLEEAGRRAMVRRPDPTGKLNPPALVVAGSQSITCHGGGLPTLLAIPNQLYDDLQQPHWELDSLYRAALQEQPQLASYLQRIASSCNALIELPPLKSPLRAREKISYELSGKANKLHDVVRASFIVDDINELLLVFAVLQQQLNVVQVKNRFRSPTLSGYRDLNVLVRLPESDLIAEVQLHLGRIAAVKNGPEHRLYEQIQCLQRLARAQRRQLTDIERTRINRWRKISRQLYQQAWRHYLPSSEPTGLPLSA